LLSTIFYTKLDFPVIANPSLLNAYGSVPGPGFWTEVQSMNYGRLLAQKAVVNGKIYVIGGRDEVGARFNYNEEYDPIANSWTTKASIPTQEDAGAIVAYNGKIYVAGGYPNGKKHYVYDPQLDSWSDDPTDLPFQIWDCGSALIGQYFYIIGGSADANVYTSVIKYDLINGGSWSNAGWMSFGFAKCAVSVHNGKMYVFTSNWAQIHQHCGVFDPSTGSWTNLSDAPYPFMAATPTSIDGYVYLLRDSAGSNYMPNFFAYDPVSDTYTEVESLKLVNELRTCLQLVNMGSDIYHCGGSADGYKNRVFRYRKGVAPPESPVGGISIPVNKLELLAPYIGLTTLLTLAVVTVSYVKKRKREIQRLTLKRIIKELVKCM